MMNKLIIHISDLHVSLHEDLKGNHKAVNSWLTTDPASSVGKSFITQFTTFLFGKYKDHSKYLLITGDISNESDESEYAYSEIFIKEIIDSLNINLKNVLILPGDHDINREKNRIAFREGKSKYPNKKSYEYNEEKYIHFKHFYEKVLGRQFKFDKTIIDYFEIADVLFIGLNSNFFIDYEGGLGGFNLANLEKEISEMVVKYPSHLKVAVFHHNITSLYEDKATGQWDLNNRKEVIAIFERVDIKCVLTGNEHTRGTSKLSSYIDVSDAGTFTSIKQQASFKCYELISNETHKKLLNHVFTIQNRNNIDDLPFGKWGSQTSSEIGEIEEFVLWEKPHTEITEDNTLDNLYAEEDLAAQSGFKDDLVYYQNPIISTKLYNIIREKKLYHSGHFHWSDTSRAHNWIDVSKILEDKDDLLFVKKAIIDVVESCELKDKFDFVLGLGTEGNIISTRLAIMYGKDYSYLPYSYRYEDHNEFEQKLNFVNNGKYKNVLVITDVVNDGRTIRKLIGKREKDFFNGVEKIYVIALVYTGDSLEVTHNILNCSSIKDFDVDNDEVVNNIEFYSILNLKVEKCPYTNSTWKECLIYKDKLDCVNLFYNEK